MRAPAFPLPTTLFRWVLFAWSKGLRPPLTGCGLVLGLLFGLPGQPAGMLLAQTTPLAANDLFYTTEGYSVPLTILANDIDLDDDIDTSTLTVITPALHGITSIDFVNGIINYYPDAYFNGIDEFRYQISDQTGLSNSAQVTLFVYPVNNPPLVLRDLDSTLEGNSVYVRVVANDDDPLDPLGHINPYSLSILTAPLHGSAAAISGPLGRVLYTPVPGFTGLDSFQYSVCDDGHPLPGICGSAWAVVNVRARVVAAADKVLCPGDSVKLTATGPGPYTWSPATGLSCTNCNSPWATPSVTTLYTVTSTAGGCCPNSDDILVTVYTPGSVQAAPDYTSTAEDGTASVDVLDNDLLVDSAEFYPLLAPGHGSIVWSGSGSATYTPNPDFYGSDSAAYLICPPACPQSCDTGWVYVEVLPVNDPPLAVNDTATGMEDVPLLLDVLANDSDIDASLNPASVSVVIAPLHGTAIPDLMTGEITYIPDPDFSGTDAFRYEVCDNGYPLPQECGQAWVFLTILEQNDSIVAVDDADWTFEDNAVVAFLLGNDYDPENRMDTASLTILSGPLHGSVSVFPLTGGILYAPDPDYNGYDSLQYRICDDQVPSTCDNARWVVTIVPVNDPPEPLDDVAVTDEEVPVSVAVLINDSDPDGGLDAGSLAVFSGPYNGSASVDTTTGEITYTPAPDFNGTDSLRYTICDDGTPLPGECSTALLVILVIPVNDGMNALDDALAVWEDTPAELDVLANDSDPDGLADPASVLVLNPPVHGTAIPNPATGRVLYSPELNYYGPDSLRYEVCDDGFPTGCDTAWVRLNVQPVNDAPTALADTLQGWEDTPLLFNPLLNDSDIDGSLLLDGISLIISPLNGIISIDGTSSTAIYTPAPGFFGLDSALYQICDTGYPLPAACDSAWVFIEILEIPPVPNVQPVALNDAYSLIEDTPADFNVLDNDSDPDGILLPSSLLVLTPPTLGTAIPDWVGGTIAFTPDLNQFGVDSLRYRVCDNGPLTLCDTAWVYMTIQPVNDPPVALDDLIYTGVDTAVYIPILTNDSDVDGSLDAASGALVIGSLHGTVSYDPLTGELLYTPDPGYTGLDSLQYQICDDGFPAPPACDSAWVVVHVGIALPVNTPPVALNDTLTVLSGVALAFDPLLNDSDLEGPLDAASLVLLHAPLNGSLSTSAPWTYTSDLGFSGLDSLAYLVCDLGFPSPVLCDSAWVFIQVEMDPIVHHPPVAVDDFSSGPKDTDQLIPVLSNDTDVDGDLDPTSCTVLVPPAQGSLSGSNGDFVYRPDEGWCGLDSFSYRICDATGLCDEAWVRLQTVCTAFYALDDWFQAFSGQAADWEILANDAADAEGYCVTILQVPLQGEASVDANGLLRYTPGTYYTGSDSLRYQVCNSSGTQVAEAMVRFSVLYDGLLPAGGLSPNGDGRNDTYRILGLEQYPDHQLHIVNRWGDAVFSAAPYANDWDGRYRGAELPEGTYFYILQLDPADPKAVLSGAITLRR